MMSVARSSSTSTSPTGRMQALAQVMERATAGLRAPDEEQIAELRDALVQLHHELRPGWPAGTPDAILRALLADDAHTVTSYLHDGTRLVERYGPWRRTREGGINWKCPMLGGVLGRRESFANGLDTPDMRWVFSTTLPDGSRVRRDATPRHDPPTAHEMRTMVADCAAARGETALLEHGLAMDVGAWMASAPVYAPDPPSTPDPPCA